MLQNTFYEAMEAINVVAFDSYYTPLHWWAPTLIYRIRLDYQDNKMSLTYYLNSLKINFFITILQYL